MSPNTLGSDTSGKSYSRRDFLKLLGITSAGVALTSSAVYALAHNLSDDTISNPEDTKLTPSEDISSTSINTQDAPLQSHEQEEQSTGQILLDHAATGLFLGHILPQFMKNNPRGAFKVGAAGIASWYSLSGEVTREHFVHEMNDAMQGVAMMVAVLQATESIQVNYKKAMNDYLFDAQDEVISHVLTDNKVQKLLDMLNVRIDKNLEFPLSVRSNYPNGFNGDNSVDYTHIAISVNKFSELLPLLVTNIDHFKNAVLRSIAHEDYHRYAKDLLNKNGPVDTALVEEISAIKEDVLLNEKELIKGRIAFLTQFIFLTQIPLFGVGQAGVLKNEIKSIANSVKNLFKSAGYLQTDAVGFSAQVEAKLTAFLFNRFAYASDIGPMTASFQIGSKYNNGLKGLLNLVQGMIPVAIANIKPLFDELDIVFDNVVPNQGKKLGDKLSSIPSDLSYFVSKTFTNIKGTVGSLNTSKFTLSGNQAFLNNWVIAKEIQQIDPHMALPFDYEDSKHILKDIRQFFDHFPTLSVNPVSIDIAGQQFGLYGILFYMERLVQSDVFAGYTEAHKRKTRERINKILLHTSFDFSRVQKALHFLEKNSRSAERLANFLDGYLPSTQYTVINHDDLFDKVTASRVQESSRDSYDVGLDRSIVPLGSTLYASDKALLATLRKNVCYLSYLKEHHNDLYESSLAAFVANISLHDKRVQKILPQMRDLFSIDEIEFWNTLFVSKDILIPTIIEEKNFSDIVDKLNIPKHIYDKIKDHPLLQKISLEALFHRCEKKIGANSREVVVMVLLIQSPYVVAVVSTVNHWLDKLPKDMNPFMKKYLIGFVTYFLSMFADNYVGEVIGHQLIMKNFPDMDPFDAIQFIGPLAVLGGSQVITGNSPNTVIGTMQKMYGTSFNMGGKDRDMIDSPEFVKWSKLLLEMMYDVVSVGSLASNPLSLSGGAAAVAQLYKTDVFGALNKKI